MPITASHARGDAGFTAGGDGGAEILLQAKALQRQPLLGIPVPNGQVPARLPQTAIHQQRRCQRMGGDLFRSVQPPAPPQRHQVRDAPPAPQWSLHRNLQAASRGLRDRPPGQSNALEPEHPLLAPTRQSVDQQVNRGAQSDPGATINPGSLSSSRRVTPFLKVIGPVLIPLLDCRSKLFS